MAATDFIPIRASFFNAKCDFGPMMPVQIEQAFVRFALAEMSF